jgi:type I restriction enzyme M protein
VTSLWFSGSPAFRAAKARLGQLIDLIGNVRLGDEANRSRDLFGRVYEYFLSQFASDAGRKGGQFYTPNCVVRILVEMLAPYNGRVLDPCCGSGGMLVQSVKFVQAHASGNGNGGRADVRRAAIRPRLHRAMTRPARIVTPLSL